MVAKKRKKKKSLNMVGFPFITKCVLSDHKKKYLVQTRTSSIHDENKRKQTNKKETHTLKATYWAATKVREYKQEKLK